MKACPWCGRNNLDSDEYCFNCERDLDAVPDAEEALELEHEIRHTRVYRPPSIPRLVIMSLLRKIILALLAFGAFFIIALVAIWVSYDNTVVFLVVTGVMGAAVLAALYYPDAMLSRKVGLRGVWVTLISNTILLVVLAPPTLWFMSRRGYIGGASGFLVNWWWAFLAFLAVGILISWLAGRRAYAEAARP
jgi:hypothetical protein